MKINIPRITVAVDLGEYAAELSGQKLHVWVNPARDRLQEYDDLVTALQEKELDAAKKTLVTEVQTEGEKGKGLARIFDQVAQMLQVKRSTKSYGVDEKLLRWYVETWSQGPEESHWTVNELRELEAQDPACLSWMISRTWQERTEHIQRKKKA